MNRIAYILCLAFMLGSCTPAKRQVSIVGIDLSQSVDSSFSEYVSMIEYLITHLKEHDCLIVIPVDGASRTKPTQIIRIDMDKMSFTDPGDGVVHSSDSIRMRRESYTRQQAIAIADTLLAFKQSRSSASNFSDILGCLQGIESLLEQSDTCTPGILERIFGEPTYQISNVIVILSDMLQDSPEYSLETQSPEEILETLPPNHIPNLQGAEVILHGLTANSPEMVDRIEVFWQQYFTQTGATVLANQFDASQNIYALFE